MNKLIVGRNKDSILKDLPDRFLLIDDNSLDDFTFPKHFDVTHFDVSKHSFDPLKNIDYQKAREFISVLDAVFPEGANTLTKKNSNFILLNALLSKPKRLDKLFPRAIKSDPAQTDAYQKIQTLLLSPVLKNVLCRPTNFSFDGIVLARLDRAELGDFDCFVLANLLISQYKGAVVIPDFGFYGRPHHAQLIRQNRLIAGINFFDEVPELRNDLLLMVDDKSGVGHRCLPDDAEILAQFAGYGPTVTGHSAFIKSCIE